MGNVWLIASGKGGVGKSTLASALAIALADRGQKTCVADFDIGLRDQDLIMDLADRTVFDVLDVLEKRCRIEQALLNHPDFPAVSLLPAAQFARCRDLSKADINRLLGHLKGAFDTVIIDAPAGMEKGLRNLLCGEVNEIIIVCTPDDICIRNAERVISLLREKEMPSPVLVVNRMVPKLIRRGEMYKAETVALTLDIQLMGEIPEDEAVTRALFHHQNPIRYVCYAGDAMDRIAGRMTGENEPLPAYGAKKHWWNRKPLRLREAIYEEPSRKGGDTA